MERETGFEPATLALARRCSIANNPLLLPIIATPKSECALFVTTFLRHPDILIILGFARRVNELDCIA